MSTGSIPVISFFYCLKIKDFLNFSNSKVIRTEVLMFFDILLRTVCTSRMTRDMLYLQCCPTDTRQREEVSFLSAIKNKKKPPVFALLRASFFLSTWTCYFFSPTGIIAYADQEINMQVIPKQIKKSKLSPWFMPYFSKMAQLIGLLSVVGVHPWLLLVLQ